MRRPSHFAPAGIAIAVLLFLATAGSLLSPFRAFAVSSEPARPNIVFILVDDLRWDALGCTGHPFSKTPNIDRIANEGARFDRAFVTTPLCSPSRASFLTGQYVHTNGIRDNTNRSEQSHRLVTFPALLQKAGYETAYVGKWHMGNDDSPRPGFNRWVSFRGQGAYVNPPLNIDGQQVRAEGYITDILTDHAAEFIRKRHDGPFCLYLAHKAVHGPFTPAERHRDLYADQPIVRSPNAKDTLEGKPVLRRPAGNLPPIGPGTGSGDMLIRNQLRCLASIDEGVGRILKALEEMKQLDNTVVVFTSDNGYFWGEHGLGDKRAAYEESIRIPLLMRYPPRITACLRVNLLALNIDVAPTLLELGGTPVPKEMQGRSLLAIFRGTDPRWRTSFLGEYFAEAQYPRIPDWQAVRTTRWKYIRYPALDGMDELYRLVNDEHEMKNLIDDPGSQPALREVKGDLERHLKETSPNPASALPFFHSSILPFAPARIRSPAVFAGSAAGHPRERVASAWSR